MSSAFAKPIIVRDGSAPVVLERVPLTGDRSTARYSEAWLQDLLYSCPESLPIAEIDDGFAGLIPVCKEMNTPAGPVDVVFVTPRGRPVIVEAKLWRNPEARRKVVGQILDYAKELSGWDYETFDAAVRRARRTEHDDAEPQGLVDLVRARVPDFDEARFCDSVSQSLHRGDLLLLIVGDGIREGVGAITQFVEGHGTLHFTFGLVEMAIHQMPDGGHLVQPRVLAQSTIVKRMVVSIGRDGIAVEEDGPQAEQQGDGEGVGEDVLRARRRFASFWARFLDDLVLDDKSQPVSKPATSTNQYFMMPAGSQGWVSAFVAQSANRVGVYLGFQRGPVGDRLYEGLLAERPEIERALGIDVHWEQDRRRVVTRQPFAGVLPDEHADEIRGWLGDRVNRFVTVFRPRIKRLMDDEEEQAR